MELSVDLWAAVGDLVGPRLLGTKMIHHLDRVGGQCVDKLRGFIGALWVVSGSYC